MPAVAKRPKSAAAKPTPKPKTGDTHMLQFTGAAFTAQLPWFFHGLPFARPRTHDIYSFEVNALTLRPDDYTVALIPKGHRRKLAVGFDAHTFHDVPVRDGRVELPKVGIRDRMLSFYVRAANVEGKGPLESVWVYPPTATFAEAKASATPFRTYRRNIRVGEREHLLREKWPEFHGLLRRKGFGKKQLRAMFDDIVAWCKRRQVLDPNDRHYGAIYSEEDKYDFRDAAAAAVCFAYAWRDTGDEDYRRCALLARDYVYNGQHMNPKDKAQYGGFSHMIHGEWGPGLQRLGGKLPNVSGVETCIDINLLIKAIELGLKPSRKDIERIKLAAKWVADNEFKPGIFSHDAGSTHDCQNSNALGAMALSRAYYALEKLGEKPPKQWLEAARRGMLHWLEGQEAIGCWPYVFAMIGRGQAFWEHNVPDQGMGTYHFLVACQTPAFRKLPGIEDAAKRAARWWLCMSHIDRRAPMPTINIDDRRASGQLKFSAFTWCRFMAAASLMRIAELTDEKEPWRHLAMRYMEHVHTKLWNTTDPTKAPVRRATRDDMTLCSWIQAAEWAGVLLREMEERLP